MQSPFIWQGNQAVSPQAAARDRQIAEALLAQNSSVATNPWEGLAQVARAYSGSVLGDRADAAQSEGERAVAELLMGLGPDAGYSDILGVLGNEWASPEQTAIAQMLMSNQLRQSDPLYQAQLAAATAVGPWAGIETVNDQLIQMTPEGPVVVGDYRDAGGGETSAREEEIARLQETGLDRITAINIADGRWIRETNPVTGEFTIMDMATGLPVNQQPEVAPEPQMSQINPEVQQQFGNQFSASPESFGVGGAAQGGINTVMDAIGVGAPYPEIQQTQADFGILRESLLNDIASSYGRQPPSWLLQEIRNLTPSAGSPFEGAGQATSKLNALGRHLENEIRITQESLQRELSPSNRQELESRLSGLTAGLSRVTGALQSFGGEQAPAEDDIAPLLEKYGVGN